MWTLVPLPDARFPEMGAEMLGLLVLMVERGRLPSSPPSRSLQSEENNCYTALWSNSKEMMFNGSDIRKMVVNYYWKPR